MSEPTVTCGLCSRQLAVRPTGRGFPPDVAKRKLKKACNANGCPCEPAYRAGVLIGPRPTGQREGGLQ
jgi:hypothetical protein